MKNNKEVIILRSNPVNPDSRVEKEAISLTRMGIKVKIVCWDRSNNYSSQESILNINGYSIPIVRIGYKASFGEGFKNIIPYLKLQFFNRKWIKKYKNNISVVHACDFDTAFFTYKLCKKLKIRFVYDIFDFFNVIITVQVVPCNRQCYIIMRCVSYLKHSKYAKYDCHYKRYYIPLVVVPDVFKKFRREFFRLFSIFLSHFYSPN